MAVAKAVIGAGYGDEGKGLITDYLSAKHAADVVVRFNGGCQAGHTVETPAGERHIFGHISAGSFTGASTFLSKFFVCNPLAFIKEFTAFSGFWRAVPDIYVDPRAQITTPYDMLINQMAEEVRGGAKHGSCGLGFGETIERCNHPKYALTYQMLEDPKVLSERLTLIRDEWYPTRCKELGIDPERGGNIARNENVFKNFLADASEMFNQCYMDEPSFLVDANQVVFEGAQGLMLDQNYGAFPHVTRSYTGMTQIEMIMDEIEMDELEVWYATRTYVTRHGAGPLSNELQQKPYKNIVDETNITNKYQGSLRFAYLDLDILKAAIEHDKQSVGKINPYMNVKYGLAVTCLDQVDNEIFVYRGGNKETLRGDSYGDVADLIHAHIGLDGLIKSFGPTRATIKERE